MEISVTEKIKQGQRDAEVQGRPHSEVTFKNWKRYRKESYVDIW
jgi:hypothetical protein